LIFWKQKKRRKGRRTQKRQIEDAAGSRPHSCPPTTQALKKQSPSQDLLLDLDVVGSAPTSVPNGLFPTQQRHLQQVQQEQQQQPIFSPQPQRQPNANILLPAQKQTQIGFQQQQQQFQTSQQQQQQLQQQQQQQQQQLQQQQQQRQQQHQTFNSNFESERQSTNTGQQLTFDPVHSPKKVPTQLKQVLASLSNKGHLSDVDEPIGGPLFPPGDYLPFFFFFLFVFFVLFLLLWEISTVSF